MIKGTLNRALFNIFFLVLAISLPTPFHSFTQQDTSQLSGLASVQQDVQLAKESEAKSDFNQASRYYHQAATAYWAINDLENATLCFTKAADMAEAIGNQNAIYILNTNLGLLYTEMENYSEACSCFSCAAEAAQRMSRKADYTSSLINLANVKYEYKKYDEALVVLSKAEENAKELNDLKLLRNIYSVLTKIYDKHNNREESARYFDLFSAISQKLQQETLQQKEAEVQHKVSQAATRVKQVEAEKQATEKELVEKDFELMRKQQILEKSEQTTREQLMQINLLNKERELQQEIIRHQNQMRNVYLGVIALILLFAGYIYYNYREKKRANKLLQQKNNEITKQAQQLKELNQLKDKLFSIIAHDLRSPLGSLVTLLKLTKEGYFTEEGFKEIVDELSKNVGYTSELLENLLNWAQSQMQGLKVKPTIFKVSTIVDDKFELYKEQAQAKGIKLINSIDPKVTAYADGSMIDLVLRNLIANAIKFCEQGDMITVSAVDVDEMLQVSVCDTGLGMSPVNVRKLFGKEIFSTKGTLNERGSGLGLLLCKDFIALNGGAIWAESLEGEGSEFSFTLPKSDKI
ncbi:MAG: tetratricopeptide repeat-containing sensor histidine kinase [Tenuifilaceae bacterium]|jgi:signal transduction histidine kinase|nr:tetratricopeptide repeat-containing sensor histidine kinase [Tenuifilaceae bacterium]